MRHAREQAPCRCTQNANPPFESPGNPLYTQKRVGKGGKTIRILKLRSMVADAGDVQKYLSPEQLHQWEVEGKVDDDPRITKVGCFRMDLKRFTGTFGAMFGKKRTVR